MAALAVRPVTKDTWPDLVRFFEAKGGPHYCWCTPYRDPRNPGWTSAKRKACMKRLVDESTPVGLLAYTGGEPVGWCSVAPRESYLRLQRSRSMPRATPAETPTWTVLCFFVARTSRGQGITRALLQGALRYARKQGARVVEGYPFDTAHISATHRGHSSIFRALGFRQDGKRWEKVLGRKH